MSFVSANGLLRTPAAQTSSSTKLSFSPTSPVNSTRCCETGRPIMIDPLTGSTICSCQMKAGIPAYLSRLPTLADSVYRPGTSPVFPPNVVMGNEQASALYAMGLKADRQPEALKAMTPPGSAPPFYIEQLMAANPYGAFYPGFDLNGARRKNATRETTSALKAWLYEHRKNPYPTKGEKIMLAIITRMTLTQVSTWFANARRRLKKENKLEDKEDSLSDIDFEDRQGEDSSRLQEGNPDDTVDLSDISDTDETSLRMCKPAACTETSKVASSQKQCFDLSASSLSSRYTKTETKTSTCTSVDQTATVCDNDNEHGNKTSEETHTCRSSRDLNITGNDNVRPKIWSISEIISKESTDQGS